jgi:hypothetical protein
MEKLIPMEVSIRQHQLEQKQKQQREQFNQRLNNQHFDGAVETSDRKSAFRDEHIISAYAQVRNNGAKMKDDMVHATSSAPYNRKGRN